MEGVVVEVGEGGGCRGGRGGWLWRVVVEGGKGVFAGSVGSVDACICVGRDDFDFDTDYW